MRGGALIAACLGCLVAAQAIAQDDMPTLDRIEAEGRADTNNDESQAKAALVVSSDSTLEALPIMTIDRERLFAGTAWGRRVQAELTRQADDLSQENERLLQEALREEEELTRLRDTLPAEEFRIRADEFDRKVVEIRRQRDAARQELQQLPQKEHEAFFARVMPILAKLMQERQVVVVLDQKDVLIQAQSIDVTDELIARVDAELGDGPSGAPTATPSGDDAGGQDSAPAPAVPSDNAPNITD